MVHFKGVASEIPTTSGASDGDVLTKNGNTIEWATPSGGVTGATDSTLTLSGTTLGLNLGNANTWTGQQTFNGQAKVYSNTNSQQLFIGTLTGGFGYWVGRNSGTGFLDILGTQGSPFDGVQVTSLRSSGSITIGGNAVISNWSTSLGLGGGSGTASAILEIRGGTQNFLIGGGTGFSYLFQRNSSTGFMEITGQQSGYTGYIISTANGANAHTINDGGNNGFGVAIGSIGAKVHIIKTTEQFRRGYDASNYASDTVSSTGSLTINVTGTNPKIIMGKAVQLKDYTVATLPTGGNNDIVFVTDALAPVWHAAVAGGGAERIAVYYDGAWKCL